jgi:ribosomal protein S18 acetylase RimI-like enzyme
LLIRAAKTSPTAGTLKVYEFNKSALKCYEKVGFKQIGKRREALHRNLEKHNIIYMDILSEEFHKKIKMLCPAIVYFFLLISIY